MTGRQRYWSIVGGLLFAVAVVSARTYHPGALVEFSDTIYPIRPDLTMNHWMSWWWPGNMGTLWTNACWLPHLLIPWIFWRLGIDAGLGQALQYFVWLAVPVVGIAFCIEGLAHERLTASSALPLLAVPFNLYVVLSWTSSVAMYALGSEALYAWALVEGVARGRPARGLLIAALASLWMSADVANPPYFAIVAVQTIAFAVWLGLRYRAQARRAVTFCALGALVSVLMGTRWMVPTIVEYAHYPLTKLATGGPHAYDWVTARANLLNALRYTPMWYWGDSAYTYYAATYQGNAFFVLGSFAPFLLILLGLARAIARRLTGAVLLFGLALLWMFLVKSVNPPFVLFSYRIQHLPLMFLFRDSEKFIGPFIVDASIACGIAIAGGALGRVWTWTFSATALFAAVAGGWLLFSGEAFNAPRGTPPLYVRLPDAYGSLATETSSRGVTRLAVSPYDTEYQIGTRWGFFGADTEFFDDLPNAPLLHAPYASYVSHPYYDEAWKTYSGFAHDDVGRRAIERDLSIDGAMLRNDLIPYVGIAPSMWRFDEFGSTGGRNTDDALGFVSGKPSSLTKEYSSVLAAKPEAYQRTTIDLARLGVTIPLLQLDGTPDARNAVAIEKAGSGSRGQAFLFRPDEQRDATVNVASGTYDLVVRAAETAAVRRDIGQSDEQPSIPRSQPILGLPSGIIRRKFDAEPVGAVFHYQTEGAFWARTTLQLPVLGPHRPACGNVAIDGRSVARLPVGYGRQMLRVPAVVPPGGFKATVSFEDARACAKPAGAASVPLWTTGMAAPPVLSTPQTRPATPSLFTRSYRVSMPLSSDPTLWFWVQRTVTQAEDVFAVVHVAGGGCKTAIAVRNSQNVIERFDDVGRRPLLSAACRTASPRTLTIDAVDVVAKSDPVAVAQAPERFALVPSRPAMDWQVPRIPKAAIDAGGARVWSIPSGPMRVSDFPVLSLSTPRRCMDLMSASFTYGNPPSPVSVFHIREFYASRTGTNATIPIGDKARDAGAVSSDPIGSIEISSVSPASMRRSCNLDGANVARDAAAGASAWIAVDGKRVLVPRDDVPHTYAVTLSAGAHRVAMGGPLAAALLVRHSLASGMVSLESTTRGADVELAKPGWVVYSQATDSLWHGSLDNAPLEQHRANLDAQAYYAPHAGRLRIALPLTAVQTIAELVTWITLLAVALWTLRRWRLE